MNEADKSLGRHAVVAAVEGMYKKFAEQQSIDKIMHCCNFSKPSLNNDFGDIRKGYVAILEGLAGNIQDEIDRIEQAVNHDDSGAL